MTKGEADGEAEVLAKIAELSGADRAIAERVHAIVMAAAPELSPRTWYGMPAYAKAGTEEGRITELVRQAVS